VSIAWRCRCVRGLTFDFAADGSTRPKHPRRVRPNACQHVFLPLLNLAQLRVGIVREQRPGENVARVEYGKLGFFSYCFWIS
jgi:hypothetical protein